jgi:hypothetical protein
LVGGEARPHDEGENSFAARYEVGEQSINKGVEQGYEEERWRRKWLPLLVQIVNALLLDLDG